MPDVPPPIPGNGPTINGSPWLIPDLEDTTPEEVPNATDPASSVELPA